MAAAAVSAKTIIVIANLVPRADVRARAIVAAAQIAAASPVAPVTQEAAAIAPTQVRPNLRSLLFPMDKNKFKFDVKYLADIPLLIEPRATMVPHGFCYFCDKPDIAEGDSIESSVRHNERHWAVRHCKNSPACIKAAQASLAVWMASDIKLVPYGRGHPIRNLKLNVIRSSGSIDTDWTVGDFRLCARQVQDDQKSSVLVTAADEAKGVQINEGRDGKKYLATVGLFVEKQDTTKVLPMWIVFYHNPSLVPTDVLPDWPAYFPPDVKKRAILQVEEAYAKAKKDLAALSAKSAKSPSTKSPLGAAAQKK